MNKNDQASAVRAGEELKRTALETYLRANLAQAEGGFEVLQFPSGFSNLTYLIRFGDKEYVLRRPPFGANIKSAHDMGREYHILSNLIKVYPKVPRPFLFTEEESIIGAPFYVMERVQGVILRAKMPKDNIPTATLMEGIAQSLIHTLAELHAVDYQSTELANLGKPSGYVSRQVQGWTKRYFSAKTSEVKPIEKTAQWLADNLPPESDVALIHNDFKYDNVVLNPADWTQIDAILDWVMATIGDPLLDLGTSLGYWVNQDDPDWLKQLALSPTILPGNPSRSEVLALYEKASGRSVDTPVFYYVFGLFKVIVIAQQIFYRYQKGHTKDPRFAHLDKAVQGLGIMAQQAIHRNQLDGLF